MGYRGGFPTGQEYGCAQTDEPDERHDDHGDTVGPLRVREARHQDGAADRHAERRPQLLLFLCFTTGLKSFCLTWVF